MTYLAEKELEPCQLSPSPGAQVKLQSWCRLPISTNEGVNNTCPKPLVWSLPENCQHRRPAQLDGGPTRRGCICVSHHQSCPRPHEGEAPWAESFPLRATCQDPHSACEEPGWSRVVAVQLLSLVWLWNHELPQARFPCPSPSPGGCIPLASENLRDVHSSMRAPKTLWPPVLHRQEPGLVVRKQNWGYGNRRGII